MNAFLRAIFQQFRSLKGPARMFLLALFLDGLLLSGWSLFFNLYILKAGYSREFLGLVNAAPSLSALFLGIPMGLLSDRIGRKRAMLIGFSLTNVSMIGMGLARSETIMLIMALLYGALGQLFVLSQNPFMMQASDERTRDVLFSFSMGVVPLANTLGNFLAGTLPGLFSHFLGTPDSPRIYQAVLLTSVISSFAVLLPLAWMREPGGKTREILTGSRPLRGPSLWQALARPLTLKLALPNLIIGFGAAMLVPYFNIFFAERYAMSDAGLGLLFGIGSLFIGIGCLISPRLVGNLGGRVRTVVLGEAVSLIFLLATGFSPWLWLAVIGYLVRGALMNMVAPFFDAFALEASAVAEHGVVTSIRNLAWNVGWAIGPYVSGLIQQRWGFQPLFINTAVFYALAIGVTWLYFRPKNDRSRARIPA
jgi:MFS family permease